MDLSKIPSAENWRKIVSRGKYPFLWLFEINNGLLDTNKITGLKTKMTNYCRVGGNSYIYEDQAIKFENAIIEVLRKNPTRTLKWIDDYYKNTKKLFAWLNSIKNKNFSKLSKDELKKLYKEYIKQDTIIWRWTYLPFLIDNAINAELNFIFLKLDIRPEKISEAIKTLSFSAKITLHKKEYFALLKLAQDVKKKGMGNCEKEIKKHLSQWGWKNSWIYNQNPFTLEQLKKEISEAEKIDYKKELANFQKEQKKKSQEKNNFLSKFKNKHLNVLSDILAEYNFWHAYKMEEMTKAVYLAKPFFEELAKRFGIKYKELLEMEPGDVEKENIEIKRLKDRAIDCGIVMIDGERTPLEGKDLEFIKKKFEKSLKAVKTFNGFSVFSGLARGRALVVTQAAKIDVSKISVAKGTVLVVSMTSVNTVPLVKKVSAIVTDEGGLLCHAAIIARELKIPCIVGTKIATKVLTDGDLVEVDANKGIVKIIK
ncbi:MAG: PEP-utilizing enzyme [Candidatus Staskawiczbacteria bacterium]|jgi:phosphohistidine swiveling domain-containing protein